MLNYEDSNPLERRQKSELLLKKYDITLDSSLPLLQESQTSSTRSTTEISTRISILAILQFVAFDIVDVATANLYISNYKLASFLTERELSFLEFPTPEKKFWASWKSEKIWTLLWSLNILDTIDFPNGICNMNAIPLDIYPVGQNKNPNDFIKASHKLRPISEILDMHDVYYCLNSVCLKARLNKETIPNLNAKVVMERYYALQWLISDPKIGWDEIEYTIFKSAS